MAGPKEQPLPPDVMGRDDATEVLRAFVLDGGLSIAFTLIQMVQRLAARG
jgi:hypothetical protein